jgi:hypothetical protein
VKYKSLTALNRIRSPFSTFAPVKSFIHVSVRADDKVYNCKTTAISFIYLLIVGDALWCATSKVGAQLDEKKRRESGAVTLKTQTSRHMKPRGESDLDKRQTRSRCNWIKCRPN